MTTNGARPLDLSSPRGISRRTFLRGAHHVTDYAKCLRTDANDLTFACGTQHRLLKPGGWSTRKNAKGDTEWIPPARLERGQPRTNSFHFPEKLLRDGDDEEDGA